MPAVPQQLFSSSTVTIGKAQQIEMSNSDYIAISAGIVALLALFATIYQAYLTRLHNRLSVKPHLSITQLFFKEKPASIAIKNHGPGSAIIKTISLVFENKEYSFCDDSSINEFLKLVNVDAEYYHFDSGSALGAGSEMPLIEFKEGLPDDFHQRLSALPGRIAVKASYECVYGVKYNIQ